MIGLFIANPGPRAYRPRHGRKSQRGVGRSGMTRTRRNSWRGARKAHGVASHLGWAYRRDRKHGPRSVARYLSAAGISRSGLQKYRKARKTPAKYLLKKRHHRAKRYGGVLANRGRRRVGRYASFVRSFSHRHRGLRGPALMRAAGRAWRHGARRNVTIGPIATMNRPRRRRGHRRNPVLPYAAFNKPRRRHHKKRRRSHRNNPVLPYAAFNRGRRRRRHHRNPVLPYAAFNPKRGGSGVVGGLQASFQEAISVDYWTNTVLPLGAGFMLSQFVGGLVYGVVKNAMGVQPGIGGSLQRIGCRALGAIATSVGAMFIPVGGKGKGKKGGGRGMATKVLAGGLVATLVTIVQEAFGMTTYNTITGMSDFSDMAADLTEELKAKIANSVRNEIAKAEAVAPGGVSAFVSTQNLQTAPDFGGGPRIGNMGSFVSQEGLHTAPNFQAQGHYHQAHHSHHQGPPVVADLSAFSDSFADMMLV
jgi:hypothetical protein